MFENGWRSRIVRNIRNRKSDGKLENWKTTVYFSPLFQGRCGRFAERIGAIPVPKATEVRIELFWKGMRDYRYWEGLTRKDLERRAIDAYD